MSRSRTLRDHRRARRQTARAALAPKLLSTPLTDAWKHARWMFLRICAFFDTPRAIAAQAYMLRATHAECSDLIHHIELITRRIILIAALALDIILAPLKPNARERRHRRVLVWPHRPETWRTSFRMLNARGQVSDRAPPLQVGLTDPSQLSRFLSTMSLARRFEAVRRVLINPDRLVRRTAIRLARLKARSTADAPFLIRFRKLKLQPGPHITRGLRMIVTALEILSPLAGDALARWNEAADPG